MTNTHIFKDSVGNSGSMIATIFWSVILRWNEIKDAFSNFHTIIQHDI